jgi:hypothetical protein
MMYTLRDVLDIDPSSFWRLYFDREFGRVLHYEALHFASFEIAEQRVDERGVLLRRVDYRPALTSIPKLAVEVLGDGSYSEHGRYDPGRQTYTAKFVPHKRPNSFVTRTELSVRPLAARRCERNLTVVNEANVFGIGRLIESVAEKAQRRAHEQVRTFMLQWIRERGL